MIEVWKFENFESLKMNSNGVAMENGGTPSAAAAMSGSMLLEDHFDAIKYCRNSTISVAACIKLYFYLFSKGQLF